MLACLSSAKLSADVAKQWQQIGVFASDFSVDGYAAPPGTAKLIPDGGGCSRTCDAAHGGHATRRIGLWFVLSKWSMAKKKAAFKAASSSVERTGQCRSKSMRIMKRVIVSLCLVV